MNKFRPTLIPTLITIPSLVLLLILGTWQVQRLQWKNGIIADISRQMALPAIELPTPVASEIVQYQKIRLTGEFLYDKEIFLYTGKREFKGKDGYDVLTPLKREDGSLLLVDRGWIPIEARNSDAFNASRIKGSVTVEGIVMKGEKNATFTPENNPEKNLWFWIDIPAIRDYLKQDIPAFYILQGQGKDKSVLPIGSTMNPAMIRNDHLQYAITWYGAALSLLVIYYLYHRKPQ